MYLVVSALFVFGSAIIIQGVRILDFQNFQGFRDKSAPLLFLGTLNLLLSLYVFLIIKNVKFSIEEDGVVFSSLRKTEIVYYNDMLDIKTDGNVILIYNKRKYRGRHLKHKISIFYFKIPSETVVFMETKFREIEKSNEDALRSS